MSQAGPNDVGPQLSPGPHVPREELELERSDTAGDPTPPAAARPVRPGALWSPGDIERELEISRQTVHRWRKDPTFPAPAYSRPTGQVLYDPAAVRAWERGRRANRDHRRGAAKGRYRQLVGAGVPGTRALVQIAKEIGVSDRTVRRWLQQMGEVK